jgi:hypothetical protein
MDCLIFSQNDYFLNFVKIFRMFCKVTGCRYPSTHVSAGHKCGTCGRHGHGQYECKRPQAITYSLEDIIPEGMQCTMLGCSHKKHHVTAGHCCDICAKWGTDCSCPYKVVKCPVCRDKSRYIHTNQLRIFGISQKCAICLENDIELILPTCRHACLCIDCLDKITEDKEELKGGSEMENVFASARERIGERNNVYVVEYVGQGCLWYIKRVDGAMTGFFLHGDNHGQYGEETNDIPALERFLAGCTEI